MSPSIAAIEDCLRAFVFPFLCVLQSACGGTSVVRHGPPAQHVVGRTWNVALQPIRSRILEAFKERRAIFPEPFNLMPIHELKLPEYSADWAATFIDPGGYLEDYRRLAPELRQDDLWLDEASGDAYWPSEYETPAGPARFRSGLVLHFAATAGGTRIEAYETVPTVWVGEHWALTAHGVGFGRYHDIRFVEPTMQERTKILDVIDGIVSSQP